MAQRTPTRTLWVGIVTTAVGLAALTVSGDLVPNVMVFTDPSGQAILGLISFVDNAVRFAALPLGCALIGAGLVMRYLRDLKEHATATLDPDGAPGRPQDL